MWNYIGKGRENKRKTERGTNHKKLLNTQNKMRVAEVEVGGRTG